VKTAVEIAESRKSSAMYAGRPWVLLERGWIAFRSTNWIPVVTGFVEPVLFLLAFGYGMGNLVGDVTTGNTTMDYTLFIAPGLLANSAMNGAIYDSTWNVFWKLNESKLYKTMLSTPLGPLDIALGEITWALVRGLGASANDLVLRLALPNLGLSRLAGKDHHGSAALACNRNGSGVLVWKSNLRCLDSYWLLHSDDRYRTFRNFSQITRTVPSLIQTIGCIRY